MTKKLSFLPKFRELFEPYRYKCMYGGRGGAKTKQIAIALIYIASRAKTKVLCVRQFMNSIAESSKASIEEVIEESGTSAAWEITNTEIYHKLTGSRFIFRSAERNVASIKSIPDIDIMWWEEADTATQDSLNTIIPTIRKPNSQCWFSWNRKNRSQPINQMFLENEPPPNTLIIYSSYLDNPFISDTFIADADAMKRTNEALYSHIYLGQYLDEANLYIVRNIKTGEAEKYPNDIVTFGVDCARSGGDATVICVRIGRNVVKMRELYNVDIDVLTHELQSLIYVYKPDRIAIDSTGHGAWAADALKGQGIDVVSVNFAEKAKQEKKFSNRRSEMYGLAQKYFESGGRIPVRESQLKKELEASRYTLDNKNRIKMVPKDEIKLELGRSPDHSDAFVLSLTGESMFNKLMDNRNDLSRELISAGGWG
jgi:phage terminase large subunit